MNKQFMNRVRLAKQAGFTLIELIVVIVILGILAATALPKFADLGTDARASTLQAARGSMDTAISMARGKYLISGGTTAALDGVTVTMSGGYPTADANFAKAAGLDNDNSWTNSFNTASTAVSATSTSPALPPRSLVVVPKGVAGTVKSVTCFAYYQAADVTAATGTTPEIVNSVALTGSTSTGC